MKNWRLSIALFQVFYAANIYCQNQNIVYQKRVLAQFEQEIILEGAGEHPQIFKVPESVAYQSPVLKGALEKAVAVNQRVRQIQLEDIASFDLQLIVNAMKIMQQLKQKDPHMSVPEMSKQIEKQLVFPPEVTLDLINKAAYLKLEPLVIVLARFIAQSIHDELISVDDIVFEVSQELIAEVARQYYLLFNQTLQSIDLPYGVSVRELLELKRLPAIPDYLEYDLSGLKINNLDGLQDIPKIGTIKLLNLSRNELTKIKAADFVGLGNLETLNLSNNRLTHLTTKSFKGLGSLMNLYVAQNNIEMLDAEVFMGLGSLKRLDLSSNRLTNFAEQLFSGLGNLQWLNLSSNLLNTLSYKTFKDIAYLRELNLQDNKLTQLVNNGFSELSDLEVLNVSYNLLQTIQPQAFAGLGALKSLNLANNKLVQLVREVFAGLKNLLILNLSNNQLSSLDVFLFKDLHNLLELDLSYNQLKSSDLATGVLASLQNLEVLRITNNKLSMLADEIFNSLLKLKKLYLLGNQIPSQSVAQREYQYKHVDIIF